VLEELKVRLQRVLDAKELRLKDKSAVGDNIESLKVTMEVVKQAKQKLFERLADRQSDRETFKVKKAAYDEDIAALEQKKAGGVWDRFMKDVIVYPGPRVEIHWNFYE